jgi:hypothetical protein
MIYSLHNIRFSSLDGLLCAIFYVRSKLEHASIVWNAITSTDANKLERNQQKFVSVSFYPFSPHVPYTYTFALGKLSLHSLCERRYHLDALFLFRFVVALNSTLPFWKMLAFVLFPSILGTSQCSVVVPVMKTLLC